MAWRDALRRRIRGAIRQRGFDVVRYPRPATFRPVPGPVANPTFEPEAQPPEQEPVVPLGERDVAIGGTTYRIASDDVYLRDLGPEFEPPTVRLFDTLTLKEHVVLDIGANIGCTTILFGSRSRQVVGFEPSPSTFAFLTQNLGSSGLGNVELRNYALGDESSEAELAFAPDNRSGGFVTNQTRGATGLVREQIVVKRLDDIVPSLGVPSVDLVKLDVEGFETRVIRGGEKTIREAQPVVVLELNHWCLNALQRISVPDFFDYLRLIFPILVAVEGDQHANLHDNDESYTVMYRHILHQEFAIIVAAFRPEQLARFHASYRPLNG